MTRTIFRYLKHWGVPEPTSVRRPTLGTNNTHYVLNERYVLRQYDNLAPQQIDAEHRLLAALAALDLPFAVPAPIPAKDGRTLIDQIALFPCLPGEPGDRQHLTLAGEALAELDLALATLPATLVVHDWDGDIHPAVPDIAHLADQLDAELPGHPGVTWFRSVDPDFDDSGLPRQLVHGDWALGNLLVQDGRVTAALDFEIAGLTTRINDVVAGFTGCVDWTEPTQVDDFCRAYLHRIDLTDAERDAFPRLLRQRMFGSAVWRAGRWRRGQDPLDAVADRLSRGAEMDTWLATSPNPLDRSALR